MQTCRNTRPEDINVHSAVNPNEEIRAQLKAITRRQLF